MRCAGVALLVCAAALPGPAAAVAGNDFRTPGRAAYCDYVPKGEIIEGGIPNPRPNLFCWTPNDGFYVNMYGSGRPWKGYSEDQLQGAHPRVNRVLRFGQVFRRGSFVCRSRSTGLTCTNAAHHGWWLGRFAGYRLL